MASRRLIPSVPLFVVDHSEQEMLLALYVDLPGAVHAPDTVGRAGKVTSAPPFSASLLDVVLMATEEIADEGLADGVAVEAGVMAIEHVSKFAAARFN